MRTYQMFWDDMAVIEGVILKNRHIVVLKHKKQALEQLHVNHIGIEKAELLACESIPCTGMNNDTENHIKMLYMSWIS